MQALFDSAQLRLHPLRGHRFARRRRSVPTFSIASRSWNISGATGLRSSCATVAMNSSRAATACCSSCSRARIELSTAPLVSLDAVASTRQARDRAPRAIVRRRAAEPSERETASKRECAPERWCRRPASARFPVCRRPPRRVPACPSGRSLFRLTRSDGIRRHRLRRRARCCSPRCSSRTFTDRARACLATLFSASWAMRYTLASTSGANRSTSRVRGMKQSRGRRRAATTPAT